MHLAKVIVIILLSISFFSCQNNKATQLIISAKKDTLVKVKNLIPVLILDAGHGGVDPGGVNDSLKLSEKNITRKIVDAIVKIVDTDKVKIIQTREKDANINRHIRIKNANEFNPDLLVTIHTNFDDDSTINGFEISFNDSSFFKVNPHDTANIVNPNKTDLMQLSKTLDKNIAATFPTMKNRYVKVRKDHIWMIYAPKYPSVLVEFGFISNRSDATIMTNPKEVNKLAKAIVKSVYTYFKI